MQRRNISPGPAGGYAQAVQINQLQQMLFIGQTPEVDGIALPDTFEDQWRNVESRLESAGMTLDNLVNIDGFPGRSLLRTSQSCWSPRIQEAGAHCCRGNVARFTMEG